MNSVLLLPAARVEGIGARFLGRPQGSRKDRHGDQSLDGTGSTTSRPGGAGRGLFQTGCGALEGEPARREHIARRFADYQRIVAHWRETPALEWLDVRYEGLVGDLEGHARRLSDFVGLEWDPACLEFHSTKRVVRTPSLLQVRQPIHSQAIGRWKKYEPSLQPLFRAFERHGVHVE